ncbi:MAG: hypothetical protein NUV91_08695 [Candidatus Omnitrophica bacterium]|nr:hypothetical protein [Candidatus Omnitrophota bacterium]
MEKNQQMTTRELVFSFLWLTVAIVPLVTLLLNFIFLRWDWGLMDDMAILNSGSTMVDRFQGYGHALMEWGVLRFTFVAHSSAVYTLFENNPQLLYIFKLFEICMVLLIWGFAAFRITGRKISIVLVPAITLSFHYFYDAFFYLSSHEFLGLFFVGCALHFFLNSIDVGGARRFRWGAWVMTVLFLLCAFGAKEPFVSCGVALGMGYLYLSWEKRGVGISRSMLLAGSILILITVFYVLWLLQSVKSGYSSRYDMFSIPLLSNNFMSWMRKDFLNHSVWVLGAFFIIWKTGIPEIKKSFMNSWELRFGVVIALLLYGGYFLILLPWSTITYYATPLGLFFAFLVTILISRHLFNLRDRSLAIMVIVFLIVNQFVCQYALRREAGYMSDTIQLREWFKKNHLAHRLGNDDVIFANAMEASRAIPLTIERKWQIHLEPFRYSLDPEAPVENRKANFYLYSPRFATMDLNQLANWELVFQSQNWVMYKRGKSQ